MSMVSNLIAFLEKWCQVCCNIQVMSHGEFLVLEEKALHPTSTDCTDFVSFVQDTCIESHLAMWTATDKV